MIKTPNSKTQKTEYYTSADKLVHIFSTTKCARYPRHDYPVVMIQLSLTQANSRVRRNEDGSVDYVPTIRELESICRALNGADPGFSYSLKRTNKARNDATPLPDFKKKRIDDRVAVETKKLETPVAAWCIQTKENTRARLYPNDIVELQPSYADLRMLLEARLTTDPFLHCWIHKNVQPKPEERKLYWQRINEARHSGNLSKN